MPQDPVTAAIIGAIAVILAQIVGQSIATFFGARGAAHISQLGQERIARERDRREWRRALLQPMLDEAQRRLRLFTELGWAIERDVYGDEAHAPSGIRETHEILGDLRASMLIAPRFRVVGSEELWRAYKAYTGADGALFMAMHIAIDEEAPLSESIMGHTAEDFGAALAQLHQAAEHYIYDEGRAATS